MDEEELENLEDIFYAEKQVNEIFNYVTGINPKYNIPLSNPLTEVITKMTNITWSAALNLQDFFDGLKHVLYEAMDGNIDNLRDSFGQLMDFNKAKFKIGLDLKFATFFGFTIAATTEVLVSWPTYDKDKSYRIQI